MSTARMDADTMSAPQSVWIVAEREIRIRLRSKAFILSALITLAVVFGGVLFGGMMGSQTSETRVAVVGTAADVVDQSASLVAIPVADADAGREQLLNGEVDAVVLPDPGRPIPGVSVIAKGSPPAEVIAALSVSPAVTVLEADNQSGMLRYFVALGFALVFMMSTVTYATTIGQSVVEEKQTRVVEILLATVSARVLMSGKILGNSLLAFAQVLLTVLVAGAGLVISQQNNLFGQVGPSLIWFVVFFIFGFVMIAALYAGLAALVSRQEDLASATAPAMMLILFPYFLVIFFNSNPTVMTILSYVPFSAPLAMPLRLFTGEAMLWEPFVALTVVILATAAALLFGAKLYRSSLLRTGARVSFRQAIANRG